MRGLPVRPDAGVQVDLTAAEADGLLPQPLEQSPGVTMAPGSRQRGQVVDVEVPAPGQVVTEPETGHRDRRAVVIGDTADETVAGRSLHLVDPGHERLLAGEPGTKFTHRQERTAGMGWEKFGQHRPRMAQWTSAPTPANTHYIRHSAASASAQESRGRVSLCRYHCEEATMLERPWQAWDAATADEDPPFAVLDGAALRSNAADLVRRAGGVPIRIASKSLRVRPVLEEVLAMPGFAGVLAFTLPEALWLSTSCPDVVVGYPTADRASIARLARDERAAQAVTFMVDSVEQLDMIDAVTPPSQRPSIRVCLELDAAWQRPAPLGRLGVMRSPLRTPAQVRTLAETVQHRAGFTLVGLMAYEAQIAGVADRVPRRVAMNSLVSWVKRRSGAEIAGRRAATVAAVRQVADLEFVNGGGTGSIESTAADNSVTEIAAGSGLFAGHYFDSYSAFTPLPATGFALSVVRKPRADCATVLGGGWVASGPPGPDRLPRAMHPGGLRMLPREMAGEVQTPLVGQAARSLSVGDRVWFRHAKSGELSERVNEFLVIEDGRVARRHPTYRGEGKAFL